jgi:hypothetical protein
MNSYWANLTPPLAPSEENVGMYKQLMLEGTTLLLGVTPQMFDLADAALDIDPFMMSDKVIIGNWLDNTSTFSNIIGDGCFNLLTIEQCDSLVQMASQYSKRLIVRSFNYRLEEMRIAEHFPSATDFKVPPTEVLSFKKYSFYVWSF